MSEQIFLMPKRSELDKSVVIAWVGFPAQSQMSLFLEYPFPGKSVVMSLKKTWQNQSRVTWLLLIGQNLWPFVCFARKVHIKINQFVTVLGQDHKLIDHHSF